MRFGTEVLFWRGSNHHANNLRKVPGIYIGSRGAAVRIKLLKDDLGSLVGPSKKGESDWWSRSSIIKGDG